VVELQICKGTFSIEAELLPNIAVSGFRLSFRYGEHKQYEGKESKRMAHKQFRLPATEDCFRKRA
jgi:hypothetical protein